MRPFIVAANWKMNKSPREAVEFLKNFVPKCANQPRGREIIFFVPAIDLTVVGDQVRGTNIGWGAQNCHFEMNGAFTGENSPLVLSEIGSTYCMVGHSERRQFFHETLEDTCRKVKALHQVGITPLVCVGESLAEREASRTDEVIVSQLQAALKSRDPQKKIAIAYEPVWAIGTGKVATPEEANLAHHTLRLALSEIGGPELSLMTTILYGGSVKPDNAAEIALQREVDGFLVGGASLDAASFLQLCRIAK